MQTIEHGWLRTVLTHHVETGLYARQVEAPKASNFEQALPPPQSDLVAQMQKDPYVLDFVTLSPDARERDMERALIEKIREFLLELGEGFAFMGSQYHLEVAGQDFYLDLLFYYHRLRCLVAVDLKMEEFTPEFAGKMNLGAGHHIESYWHRRFASGRQNGEWFVLTDEEVGEATQHTRM